MISGEKLISLGVVAVIIGMFLIFVGTALQASGKTEKNEKVSAGGVVLIGPIPIIFGSDRGMVSLALIGAVILMVMYYLIFYRGVP
jgi:uncharacterized protein (TIGR00304 family)